MPMAFFGPIFTQFENSISVRVTLRREKGEPIPDNKVKVNETFRPYCCIRNYINITFFTG